MEIQGQICLRLYTIFNDMVEMTRPVGNVGILPRSSTDFKKIIVCLLCCLLYHKSEGMELQGNSRSFAKRDNDFERDILVKILCCAGMGYEGLKASFYFSLWKGPDSLVKYSTPAVEINSRYAADLML